MGDVTSRVLIAGGLGYIGGRLASHLLATTPRLALRLTTRRPLDQVPTWARPLDVVRADLLDEACLNGVLADVGTVIHLAATNEVQSLKDPELALKVNGWGTYRLLRASHARGVRRFVYFSTFHVYGPGAAQPITEGNSTRPVHPYGITHRLAEDLVHWYGHSYGMETWVLRLSNGYGAPMDLGVDRWSLVFNDLCRQAAERQCLTLRSSGRPQLDFISLEDVGRAVRHVLAMAPEGRGDGLFNLGGERSMSVLELASHITRVYEERYGLPVPITTGGGDSPDSWAPVRFSIDKLKATGFSPCHNLDEEIARALELCHAR